MIMTEYELVLVVWGGAQWQQGAGLETEKARNAEGYGPELSTPTQRTSLHCICMNHCFMSCKHKPFKLAAPKIQFCGSASNA